MGRRSRAWRIGALSAALLLLAAASGCGPTVRSEPPAQTVSTSPAPSVPLSTAVVASEPVASGKPGIAGLMVHLTTFGHTGSSGPGTTILDDGRIIWSDNFGRAIESQLGADALERVQDELDASSALDHDAAYAAELRPGADPPGHGVSGYRFDFVRDGRPIVVDAQDPRSFADQAELWLIPPEMDALAEIADRMSEPVAWLGSDAFVEEIRPYQADRFLVEIHLYGFGGGGTVPDVDDVRWPFGEPIEAVGAPYDPGVEGPESRCLLIDATMALLTVAAEQAAGVRRELRDWLSSVDYEWPRAGGFVSIMMSPVLPYEGGSCVELATTPP